MKNGQGEKKGSNRVNYRRKLFHLAGGTAVVALLVLFDPSRRPAAWALLGGLAILAAIDLYRGLSRTGHLLFWKYLGPLASTKEMDGPTSSLFYAAALLIAVIVFPAWAAIGAVISLAVGDPVAAIVGSHWGRMRIGGKSIEGAAANALVSFALIRIFVSSSAVAAAGALAGAAVEMVDVPLLDDNFTVPLAAGGAMAAAAALLGL